MVKILPIGKMLLIVTLFLGTACVHAQPNPSTPDQEVEAAAEPAPAQEESAAQKKAVEDTGQLAAEREEPVWVSDQLSTESVRLFTGNRGVVKIGWKTHSEQENFGFRIYRARQSGGPYTLVNKTIIAGAGNSSTENRYVYYDKNVWVGYEYYYYLEEISYAGQAQRMFPRDYMKVVSLLYYPEKDPDFEPMPVYKTEEIQEPVAEGNASAAEGQ